MYKMKNMARLTGGLMIIILFVVSFFNWSLTVVEAALPDCGPFQIIGTCNNGIAKQLPDSQNPLLHHWTCETLGNVPIECSSAGLSRSPSGMPIRPISVPVLIPQTVVGVYTPIGNPPYAPTTSSTPDQLKCSNPLSSNWANLDSVHVPCCGYLNDAWLSAEIAVKAIEGRLAATALCSSNNGNRAKNVQRTALGITWTCGTETCNAYKEPACARELSQFAMADCSANNPDDKSKIYKNKQHYDEVIAVRVASGLDEFCEAGVKLPDACTSFVDSRWREKNAGYLCKNTKPGGRIEDTKIVRCVAGWSVPSQCGKAGREVKEEDDNYFKLLDKMQSASLSQAEKDELAKYFGLEYKAYYNVDGSLDDYAKRTAASQRRADMDTRVKQFFSLSAEEDAQLELCPKGSKAINKRYNFEGTKVNSDNWPDDIKAEPCNSTSATD